MSSLFVSIVIPVYQSSDSLKHCLKRLSEQSFPAEKFEVVVINNDPHANLQLNSCIRNFVVLNETKPGSYSARNKGILNSRGHILGFCDSDCLPSKDWIKNAVHFFEENLDCKRIGGKIELIFSDIESPAIAELYEKTFAFRQEEYVEKGTAVTANMFAFRKVFEATGLFDDNMMSGGDLEWGYKAKARGFPIGYARSVLVYHPARKSYEELTDKARRVVSGYIVLNNAKFHKNPFKAIYHAFCMLKPPVKSIFLLSKNKDLRLMFKAILYFVDYSLKIVQLVEYVRVQFGKNPGR
ncbi:glycosyltransferase [Desulfonatronovibrio magnus]|uniref:glycosyltransferase n=1 Tax=Desulfonatronovibrio magnus TaxID=698827 RepID=UPI001E631D0C|nr:glycosyltransferase [Desulfonatronovibrio magnus]